mmetsp:Transcript_91849/g.295226  ORF Transcript_91849/g.295226 Transcript_91849/m.295226 type:complete len:237 (-) Transcript_91849:1699-2409(-)
MAGGFAAGDHDHQGALDPRLFVKNLPADIDEDELREVFGLYGKISDVLVNRPTPERIERSAFIHYEDYACRDAAMVVLGDMYKFREEGPPVIVGPVRQPDKGAKGFGRDHKGGCQPPPLPLPPPPLLRRRRRQACAWGPGRGQRQWWPGWPCVHPEHCRARPARCQQLGRVPPEPQCQRPQRRLRPVRRPAAATTARRYFSQQPLPGRPPRSWRAPEKPFGASRRGGSPRGPAPCT